MVECRICFEDGLEEQLISPCSCDGSSKWIHGSCLQKWREETTCQESSKRCEICTAHYLIERIHPLETFIVYNGWGVCGELLVSSIVSMILGGFFWSCEMGITNYTSIKVFQLESLKLPYLMKDDNWLAWSYYQGLASFSLSSIIFLILLLKIHINIKRKYVYYSKIFPKLILTIFIVNSFLFVLMFVKISGDVTIISYWGLSISMLQLPYVFYYCRSHNKIIRKMNIRNIGERVLSVVNNPLNYIEARRFEIEDAV